MFPLALIVYLAKKTIKIGCGSIEVEIDYLQKGNCHNFRGFITNFNIRGRKGKKNAVEMIEKVS